MPRFELMMLAMTSVGYGDSVSMPSSRDDIPHYSHGDDLLLLLILMSLGFTYYSFMQSGMMNFFKSIIVPEATLNSYYTLIQHDIELFIIELNSEKNVPLISFN
jgi:hypothetical protein